MDSRGFIPVHIDEDPETFHHRSFGGDGRTMWVPTLQRRPTLVLGSSQTADNLDHAYLDDSGIDVVRRRSGGGAVLVSSDDVVWFDLLIDQSDSLWSADIGRSFDWLGQSVQRALAQLGVETTRHVGPLIRSSWSSRVCFAGLGPGELTVDGRKIVGMSQRRTRTSARLQVAILRQWEPARHRRFFRSDANQVDAPDADPDTDLDIDTDLDDAAIGIDAVVGSDMTPDEIVAAVVNNLPTPVD